MSCLSNFQKLKNHKEFEYVYRESKKWHSQHLLLFFKSGNINRIGFTASKKIGIAVIRNRAKRRLKALFIDTCRKFSLQSGTYIFVAKQGIDIANFKALEQEVIFVLKRLNLIDKKI